MSASKLYPRKRTPPPVRVVYTLKTAGGNALVTQDSKTITVRY